MSVLTISGYREFNNYEKFKEVLDNYLSENKIELILFGDCRGCDKLSLRYVIENKLNYKIYYANWNKFGLSAGPKRNIEMIDKSNCLVAFKNKNSKGTL